MAASGLVPGPGERALPALSGILLAISFPPFHLLLPPFVALVPFAVWLARLPGDSRGVGAAARGGLLLGVVLHGATLHWIVPALAWTSGLASAVVAFLAVVAVLAGAAGLFGALAHRLVHGGAPLWLALPVTWTATEWLQAHLPGGLAFPWLGLGTSLTAFPEVVGIAEIVGARGVTFWLALVSGLLATAWVERRVRRRVLGAAVLAVLLPVVWGVVRAGTLELRPAARVAIVVTDLPAAARRDPTRWNALAAEAVEQGVPVLPPGGVDLVVLPEGILMLDAGPASDETPGFPLLRRLAGSSGARVLFGAYVMDPGGGVANEVLGMTSTGLLEHRYRKRRLVPWVEWGPGPGEGTLGSGGSEGPVWAGPGGAPGGRGAAAPGFLICFEAAFADASRAARLEGADLLVNVSNDAWFGESSGLGRAALGQHAAHLVMRAVETRAGAVRSANGGHGFFVDPLGRVYGRAARTEAPTTRVEVVRTTDGLTPFVRFGDLAGPTSALASLVLALGVGLRRRRPGAPL